MTKQKDSFIQWDKGFTLLSFHEKKNKMNMTFQPFQTIYWFSCRFYTNGNTTSDNSTNRIDLHSYNWLQSLKSTKVILDLINKNQSMWFNSAVDTFAFNSKMTSAKSFIKSGKYQRESC